MQIDETTDEEHIDLTPFRQDNEEKRVRQQRVPWSRRAEMIHELIPSTHLLDWRNVMREDMDLFARLMRDILKIDPSQPSRPGPRRPLELADAAQQLQRMMGQDFTIMPFAQAFAVMSAGRPLTNLARRTEIPRSVVHRLLRGEEPPTAEHMEKVAAAFGKHPSYFSEWRRAFITRVVQERLEWSPETTILLYRRLLGREE